MEKRIWKFAPVEDCRIKVVGTGHPFNPDGYTFIDTVQFMNGALVAHVFVESR